MVLAVRSITMGPVADAIYSSDGSIIYVAGNNTITSYQASTGAQLSSWTFGHSLGAIDLTADGGTLVATEADSAFNGGPSALTAYVLSLGTGAVQTISGPSGHTFGTFSDVGIFADGKAVLTASDFSAAPGPLYGLDLATGTLTASASIYPSGGTIVDGTGPSTKLYLNVVALSGYVYSFDHGGNVTAGGATYPAIALAADTANNRIAISDGFGGLEILDGSSQLVENPTAIVQAALLGGTLDHPSEVRSLDDFQSLARITGLAYDAGGTHLYAFAPALGSVFEFNTADWSVANILTTGVAASASGASVNGDTLQLSADGHYLIVKAARLQEIRADIPTAIVGTAQGDTLTGTAGPDVIYGHDGNDILDGGAGADVMVGGAGDDTYYIDDVHDTIVDTGGTDTVITSIDYTAGPTILHPGASIEIVRLADGASATLIAGDAGSTLYGNSLDNSLSGASGNDTLYGGAGNDTIFGSGGNDLIHGDQGNDHIQGDEGDDTLYGDDGDDILTGGSGTNYIDGGDGTDKAFFSNQRSFYTITPLANGDLRVTGDGSVDTLHAIERLQFLDDTVTISDLVQFGTSGADDLTATADGQIVAGLDGNDILRSGGFAGVTLDGGAGDDRLFSGAGADALTGGPGIDTVDYSTSAQGVNLDLSAGAGYGTDGGAGGDSAGDTYSGIENVRGTAYHDVLFGDAGANRLEGMGGNDFLNGGAGADILDGGDGVDTAAYYGSQSGVQISLQDGTALGGEAQGDTLIAIENLRGSEYADILVGDAGANRLEGLGGDDVLTGGLGADLLIGGGGNDTFRDTAAGLDGDTISDFSVGDAIYITDAQIAGFSFSLSGHTLTYTGGSLTLTNLPAGKLYASASASGGMYILVRPSMIANDFNGDSKSDVLWRNANGTVTDWLSTGTSLADNNALARQVGADWRIAGTGDFTGDGKADLLWRNANGTITFWSGTGSTFTDNPAVNRLVPLDWKIAGTGDFNGDGKTDILWRNANGTVTDWLATGTTFADNGSLNRVVSLDWQIAGTGDFNGDGKSDVLWRNVDGTVTVWTGNGTGLIDAPAFAKAMGQDYHVAGTGDFNGDGLTDIVWRNDSGAVTVWNASGSSFVASGQTTTIALDKQIVAVGNYDGDNKDDLLLRDTAGTTTILLSNGTGFDTGATRAFGLDWNVQQTPKIAETIPFASADFNGDGKDDLLWRHAGGTVTDWLSNGPGFSDNGSLARVVPLDWKIVGTGDFNGDGKADLLWRNADGTVTDWFSNGTGFSDNGSLARQVSVDWHIQATGDFNGDGKDDILWRNANGTVTDWLSNGTGFSDNGSLNRVVSADWTIQATGDFNGDGKDDILWRNANGTVTDWFSNGSGFSDNGAVFFRQVGADWSIAGTGDFNGDGHTDILWRNADGSITDWLSNGSGFSDNAAFFRGVPLDWQIMGVGDFNADGKDDIEWRATDGTVTDWLSNGSGFTDNAGGTRSVTLDWSIQHDGTTLLI